MAKARAEIEVTASTSRLAAGLVAAGRMVRDFAGSAARGIGTAFSKLNKAMAFGDAMKNSGSFFGGQMLTRGFDKLREASGEVRDFEKELTRAGMSARLTPGQLEELRTTVRGVSNDTSIASADLLKAQRTLTGLRGNSTEASASLKDLGRAAAATGTDVDKLAKLAGAAENIAKVDPSNIMAMFSGLSEQGKGAAELRDNIDEITELLPRFAKFKGGTGVGGILQMNAALQVGRKELGSSERAMSGLEAITNQLPRSAYKLEAMGVKVFDVGKNGTKTFRSLGEIIEGIGKSQLAKHPEWLAQVFRSPDARDLVDVLIKQGSLFDDLVKKGNDAGSVQRDFASYMESSSGKIDSSLNRMGESFAKVFTPERIEAFANSLDSVSEKMSPILEGIAKISDFTLGGLFHVGQSIRGSFSSTNPFDNAQTRQDEQLFARDDEFSRARFDSSSSLDIAAARRRLSNKGAFDETRDYILAGEDDNKTTKASIERAAIARYKAGDLRGEGAVGAETAASEYLRNAHVSDAEQKKIVGDAFRDALDQSEMAQELIAAMRLLGKQPGVALHLGDNQVASSVQKSTNARTRPHG